MLRRIQIIIRPSLPQAINARYRTYPLDVCVEEFNEEGESSKFTVITGFRTFEDACRRAQAEFDYYYFGSPDY